MEIKKFNPELKKLTVYKLHYKNKILAKRCRLVVQPFRGRWLN